MDKKDRKLLKSKLFAWPLPLPHTDKKTTGARFRRRIHNSEEKRKSRHALSSADYKVNKSARQECSAEGLRPRDN